jgi:hypothetical protein
MASPVSQSLLMASAALAVGVIVSIAPGWAQHSSQPLQRPAFCIVNEFPGAPLTAEIKAGKAATKVQLPAGQNACCVTFCKDNPSPSGYQISVQAQPAGGATRQVCQATVKNGQVLRVTGTPAQASCTTAKL